jgi:osmotically-inducible protein OsmY
MLPINHVPDREVKATIVSRLRENPYTQDARIKVSVHDGVVRLEGKVRDFGARTAAVQDVETIPGVATVDVDLTIAA